MTITDNHEGSLIRSQGRRNKDPDIVFMPMGNPAKGLFRRTRNKNDAVQPFSRIFNRDDFSETAAFTDEEAVEDLLDREIDTADDGNL